MTTYKGMRQMKISTKFFLFLMLVIVSTKLYSQNADSLVQKAWNEWNSNNPNEAEKLFKLAIKTDNENPRAYIGLSYLYTLQEKYDEAWQEFAKALDYLPNKYPYIFSVWLTPKFTQIKDREKAGIIKLLESLAEDPNAKRDLQAAVYDVLGEYYESKQNLKKAKEYFKKENAISDWTLIGPFENISASGFDEVYPPEFEYNPDTTYEGKNSMPVWWFKIPAIRNDYWVDLTFYFSHNEAVYYGNTFLYSPVKQKVWIRVGTSGSLKTFLNDKLIISCFDENNNDLDTYIAETFLEKGWNRLLVKCGYSEITQCNFKVRITDTLGNPVQGIIITTDKQPYNSKSISEVRIIPNFAETFFQKKIEENPDHPENYLLLSDCYLRNDKAIEAELVLRKGLSFYPNCPIFYLQLIEAYARGEKYDEQIKTYEKLLQLDSSIPSAISYRINHCIRSEAFDEAEELIQRLERQEGESEKVLQHKIDLYSKRGYIEKLINISNVAFNKYPHNWNFTYLQAFSAFQMTRKYSDAIKILRKYLDIKYDKTCLYYLADFYLELGDFKNWEKTFMKLLELQPAAPGYRYKMAEKYSEAQNLAKAEKSILEAIQICPGCAAYWNQYGTILRMKGDTAGAISAHKEALRLDQTNFSARETLRKLEKKSSIYQNFESYDVNSIIKKAPSANDYPDDPAIYLLDDTKRVVYERGASEYVREILIKVFNNRGIDVFKEYTVDVNPYNESYNIEKAVVIKKDGSETKADIDDNLIVFKSLEPNDIIYLKYRVRKQYGGRLAKHFWDRHNFNCFYPIKLLRYSLLVPENVNFQHFAQNMPDNPDKKKTEDGIIYTWSIADEPAIKEEPNMPTIEEIGKILYVSSITSWSEIIDWFSGIAQTKTRTSYEIKEQIDSIFIHNEELTPVQKAEKIYNFITENIRYSSVSFRQSGLIPQKARDVLVNRIGDCKDVATLYIAMLKEIGINAYYVLVKTREEGTLIRSLPSIDFNHCIVAVELPNKLQFCDLTAHYHPFGTLPDSDLGGFYLLIKKGEDKPNYFNAKDFPARNVNRKVEITVKEDGSAIIKKTFLRYGGASYAYRESYQGKSKKEQEETLLNSLTKEHSDLKLLSFEFLDIDKKKLTTGISFVCEIPEFLSEAGGFKLLKFPWTDAYEKWSALSKGTRTYPFLYWTDTDTITEEINITLPKGYRPVNPNYTLHLTNPVSDYILEIKLNKNLLQGKRQMIYKKVRISTADYPKFREFYNRIIKEDQKQILISKVNHN